MSISEEYLKTIAKYSEPKSSFYVIQSGKDSRLETTFVPSLDFPKGCIYEIALHSLETYYSFPNIDKSNNNLKIFFEQRWYNITIPTGSYELKAINKELQRLIKVLGGKENDIKLEANENTFKCIMTIKDKYKVDMTIDNCLRTILGFEAKIFEGGRHVSKDKVNIMRINSILVHCDVVGSTYLNGSQTPILYSFFPDVAPGEKIVLEPKVLIYLPITLNVISRLTSWLTDQHNEKLNLCGEELTIKYHIRSC